MVLLITLPPVAQDQATLHIVLTILLPELIPVHLVIKVDILTVLPAIMVLLLLITLPIPQAEQYPVQDLRPALRVNVHLDSTG